MQNNRAPGHDGIVVEFFKANPVCWSVVLAPLFDIFLSNSYYPSEWGLVRINPIYKQKGSPHDPKNYRPISLSI